MDAPIDEELSVFVRFLMRRFNSSATAVHLWHGSISGSTATA
jgi:hypothetical protein